MPSFLPHFDQMQILRISGGNSGGTKFERRAIGFAFGISLCARHSSSDKRDLVTRCPSANFDARRSTVPRPKFRITVENLLHAARYLDGRLGCLSFMPLSMSAQEGRMIIAEILQSPKSVESADKLQAWCEVNLDSKTTRCLRIAIRKRKQRTADNFRVLTVSVSAHKLLRKLAMRDNVTLSQALEKSVTKALRS